MPLTGKQRQHLRGLAHHLDPVVQIGHAGITEAVVAQIEEALSVHELIKVKLGGEAPVTSEEAGVAIAAGTSSEIAQTIGRVLVVFRRRPQKKKVVPLPSAKGKIPSSKSKEASKGRRPVRLGKKSAAAQKKKRDSQQSRERARPMR
jgi:RNA-binding protein